MHKINMPCSLNCAEELSHQPAGCGSHYTETGRKSERRSERGKRVTLQAPRARLHPSLLAGPNNGNMLGDISTFTWHWGPGWCSPGASLAGTITAKRANMVKRKKAGRFVKEDKEMNRLIVFSSNRPHSTQDAGKRRWGWEKRSTKEGRQGKWEINCMESAHRIFQGKVSMFHNDRCCW